MKSAIVAAMALVWAGGAVADDTPATPVCVAPAVPAQYVMPPITAKPAMPSCINMKTRISTCSAKVLTAYNDAIDRHNAELEKVAASSGDYADTVNKYGRDAVAYSNCEIGRLNAQMREATK